MVLFWSFGKSWKAPVLINCSYSVPISYLMSSCVNSLRILFILFFCEVCRSSSHCSLLDF